MANLGLQDDPAFSGDAGGSVWAKLRRLVFGSGTASDPNSSGAVAARQSAAASKLVAGVTVEPVRNSSIVKLSYNSSSAAVAAKVVNGIADNFIAMNLQRRYDASSYARTFLENQLADLKSKLEDSETQLVAYAQQQNIVDSGSGATIAQTNLDKANSDHAQSVTDELKAQLLWNQVQGNDPLPQFLETPSISALRAKVADLQAQYQNNLGLYKPAYPDMQKLQAQIDETNKEIATETSVVKASIKAQYDAAVQTEKSFADQVGGLTTQLNDFTQPQHVQYTTLQREVDTNQQLYNGLLERYKEVGVAGGVGVNNISVVDKAQVPGSPYSPSMRRATSRSR